MRIFSRMKKRQFFFDGKDNLSELITYYANNFSERSKISHNGKKKYFELFENTCVSNYMVEKILDYKITNKKEWMK